MVSCNSIHNLGDTGYTSIVMIFRNHLLLSLLILLPLFGVSGQEDLRIDRGELEEIGDADIDFESYEGPVEQIETREQIRGIGRYLGSQAVTGSTVDYFERYSLTRIIGNRDDSRRAADILSLNPLARVDHIVNLRRIIGGYLEESWQYQAEDADFLARIITIYNAVHRGSMSFFEERYRSAVYQVLDSERVGLSISYQEWPGGTQLVVPIRDDRAPGDLDVVDSSPLIDEGVLAELRSRRDFGVEERKAIIEFVERVIEERTEAIVEEQQQIEDERRVIEERRDQIEEEIAAVEERPAPEPEPAEPEPTVREEPAQPEEPAATPTVEREPQPEPTPQAEEPPPEEDTEVTPTTPNEERQALDQELEQLDEQEQELDQREEALAEEVVDVEQLQDQLEDIYEDTAADQAALESGEIPAQRAAFPLRRPDGGYDITVFETRDFGAVGEQTIPTERPDLSPYQGSILIVDSRAGRLLMLDPQSLEVISESDTSVYEGADIVVLGNAILSIVDLNGEFFVGEFDSQLVLVRRSRQAVLPDTEIVPYDEGILVQSAARALISLDREEFE